MTDKIYSDKKKNSINIATNILLAIIILFLLYNRFLETQGQVNQAQIEQIIRDYLAQEPAIVVDALENYQRQEIDNTKRKRQANLTNLQDQLFAANSPILGNPRSEEHHV